MSVVPTSDPSHSHPSEAHKAACPVCNPDKTVPQLNAAYAQVTSNESDAVAVVRRVPCPPTNAALRAHYQRCIDEAVLEETKQEFRDELTKLNERN